jgi:hypothetical protein
MGGMTRNRLAVVVLTIAALTVALAACGGDDSTSSADREEEAREAALEFPQCMRERGVDMPDPDVGEGGRLTFESGSEGDAAAFERAQKACAKHLEDARPPEPSAEEQRDFREQALKHAQCMRDHGIDMPDPTFGEGGRVQQTLPTGTDPNDPAFKRAEEACSEFAPSVEESS